jgi:hypothetical protein
MSEICYKQTVLSSTDLVYTFGILLPVRTVYHIALKLCPRDHEYIITYFSTGAGTYRNLEAIANDLSRRLVSIFRNA